MEGLSPKIVANKWAVGKRCIVFQNFDLRLFVPLQQGMFWWPKCFVLIQKKQNKWGKMIVYGF